MRLTLRALLAYLYNVLEPSDADEFSGKVQESAVASGLIQRIHGITRKVRMGAPRTDAKGTVDDANNVAEYLDSSLPDEQVADYERACINSDMHLAEVASSYEVLTMVLGKPAEIPSALRERIYALPLEIALAHKESGDGEVAERQRLKKTIEKVAKTAKDSAAATQSVRTSSTHPVPEVPPYLRGKEQPNLALWILGGVAVLMIGVLLASAVAGPMDATNPIIGFLFKRSEPVADANADGKKNDEPIDDKTTGDGTGKTTKPESNDSPRPDAGTGNDTKKDDKTGTTGDSEETTPKTTKVDAKETQEADVGIPVPLPPPVEPEPSRSSEKGSDTKVKSVESATDEPPAKPAPPVDPMDVGRFVSDDQVLARLDARSSVWLRVPPRAILTAGEHLVVLPTYRPQIALASGVQVTFAGESAVQMEEPLHAGASRMTVDYGRLLVVNFGQAGSQVELNLQGLTGTLTLQDSDTVVAIDVRHFLPPGSDPQSDARVLVIELLATSGNAMWQPAEEDPTDIPPHHVLSFVAGRERKLSGPFESPDWIDSSSLSDIDRLTSLELEKSLELDTPVHVRLAELMADRRVDVRALAARCLASLGEFEAIIKELSNPQQKSFWAPEVEVLRQSVTRGTEMAEQLRQTLERLRPHEGATLYRLLWGYSPEQLAGDDAKELVSLLDSSEMDVRVLASDTLRQITGAQLLYRPERAPSENRASINRWQERLADGSIAYKSPPSPLTERKPLEPVETKPANGKAKAKESGL